PYDNAVKLAKEAQKHGRIVAVCWHQGESDAAKRTPDYTDKLRTVVRNFRRDLALGSDVPFIAGDMASFYPPRIADHIDIVDRALASLAAEDPSFCCVTTKDLTHKGDRLHFDTASVHELGRRYFDSYRRFAADRHGGKELSRSPGAGGVGSLKKEKNRACFRHVMSM
ncbi:MAG: hypothetical protein IJU70_14170, partial [Lentisphaeria bacterium]|nr:hypothetical protein [Lentisphaeria bacterium]